MRGLRVPALFAAIAIGGLAASYTELDEFAFDATKSFFMAQEKNRTARLRECCV